MAEAEGEANSIDIATILTVEQVQWIPGVHRGVPYVRHGWERHPPPGEWRCLV